MSYAESDSLERGMLHHKLHNISTISILPAISTRVSIPRLPLLHRACHRIDRQQLLAANNHPRPTPYTSEHHLPLQQHHHQPATMTGFDFSNHTRNTALHAQGVPLPKATSTGTTIVGCLFEGGVVIAADTRATSGPIVADKVSYC